MTLNSESNAVPACRYSGITKRFGDLTILSGLDLEVARHEKLAIIGPSGSGKSTLLRMLMNLETINGGHIEVDGEIFLDSNWDEKKQKSYKPQLRNIGMVFQQFNLFPHMTVKGNVVEAPRQVLGLSKKEANERAEELLELVGLADKIDSHPAKLSGGQQQRVAIARALAMRPKIMLFDEVTSALDPELVGEVIEVIRKISEEQGLTMLMVTHQMEFARNFADRVAFIWDGKVHEIGPPEQVFNNPQQKRTQEFLKSVLNAR